MSLEDRVTCTACGAENRAGAKFCSECGRALAAVCPGCGAPIVAGAKFCSECGHRLGGTTAAPTAPATAASAGDGGTEQAGGSHAERRLVTVLFADLVGFTALAEGRDAEHIRDLLSRYFETASEIVRRYGGTVEKFIGDAVMAVWGAPTAHEDDAERAVRAGLDLVSAVHALGAEVGIDLAARGGVLTGEAAVTVGATNQGMVAGDLVNTASRVQSVALPGTVLVGDATRAAAEGAIAFEEVGESQLKGKAAPVAVHRALRVVAKARGVGRADALEPPFVGREAEFRLVRDAFHAVVRDRRARLVSITGEAGMGKSRLAWEFSKYTDGLADGMFWHEGRSPAYGEGISFWALSEMVRKRAGLLESGDDATTRDRIAATLEQYVPDEAERTLIAPCLLALLGVGEPPPGGRERLFAGWRLFFERLAGIDPVVLLFEDIQWADDGLLDFIESLLEWSQSYPIYVLTLARPELLERRPTWGAARNATSLPLGPLGDDAMRELLAGLVPGLPETAARTILERAGGVPLYAVETIRMLIGSGRLEPTGDGTYHAVGSLEIIDVPPSLQALIAARLDVLAPPDRALLQDASVLGQTFAVPALAAVTGESPEVLEPRLRSLVARDLLALDTDPRSPERGQYGFVQALIREVAYSTLAKRDRRSRHLAAARYFEALGDEELSGVLATHYHAAYQAAMDGPEAAALAAQARIAMRAAAERAANLGAPEQALAYYDTAVSLPGEETERLAMVSRAAEVAGRAGRYEWARSLYRDAHDGWLARGDRMRAAEAFAALLAVTINLDGAQAAALADEGLATFADLGPDAVPILSIHQARARLAMRRNDHAGAVRILEEILPGLERDGALLPILTALTALGTSLPSVGRPVQGVLLLEGVLARAEAEGLEELAGRARVSLSVAVGDDDLRRGYELSREGLERSLRGGMRGGAVFHAGNATEYALHLGETADLGAQLRSLLDIVEGEDRVICLGGLLLHAAVQGEHDTDLQALLERDAPADHPILLDLRATVAMTGEPRRAAEAALAVARGDDVNAPFAYLRAALAGARLGDIAMLRTIYDELAAQHRHGRWVEAIEQSIRAILAVAEDAPDADERVGQARAALAAAGVPFDAALFDLALLALVGRADPEGPALEARVRTVLERSGRGLLPLLDEITQAGTRGRAPRPVDARAARGTLEDAARAG